MRQPFQTSIASCFTITPVQFFHRSVVVFGGDSVERPRLPLWTALLQTSAEIPSSLPGVHLTRHLRRPAPPGHGQKSAGGLLCSGLERSLLPNPNVCLADLPSQSSTTSLCSIVHLFEGRAALGGPAKLAETMLLVTLCGKHPMQVSFPHVNHACDSDLRDLSDFKPAEPAVLQFPGPGMEAILQSDTENAKSRYFRGSTVMALRFTQGYSSDYSNFGSSPRWNRVGVPGNLLLEVHI